MTLIEINHFAYFSFITPAGISRIFVLSFTESISLSLNLLNAIAAFLANTIQSITRPNLKYENNDGSSFTPNVNPTIAKGIAKTV